MPPRWRRPDPPEDDAVLWPLSRYRDLLQDLEDDKRWLNGQDLVVTLIAGFGEDNMVHYADADDPLVHDQLGIAPGCEEADPLVPDATTLVPPPVRSLVLADAFGGPHASVCAPSFDEVMTELAAEIDRQLPPACYPQCIADDDPSTAAIDPDCTLREYPPGPYSTDRIVPECAQADDGSYRLDPDSGEPQMPSEADDVCFTYRIDAGGETSDPLDDMSPECTERNYKLEFGVYRRPGRPAPDGTAYAPECALAEFPEVECPGIG